MKEGFIRKKLSSKPINIVPLDKKNEQAAITEYVNHQKSSG